jgi:serine/threonine protein kinase
MNRNANAAPALDDASTEPPEAAQAQVRWLPAGRSAREAHAQDHISTFDDALGTNERRAALLSPGTCVAGKYIICDVLGTGGSAIVYAAEQVGLKRVVAFKLYPACGALATTVLQRFEREAQLLARVRHENVVAVFDAGCMPDGSPYLVVQRLHGESLATRLLSGPLPVMEAVDLTRQALSALSALSEAGITHRDVKPENLVLDRLPEGPTVLKLVDFGIAKGAYDEPSRVLDEMVGTPLYMAPEQVRGESVDARCDIYALGATLYEMLTGRTPHTGDTVLEVLRATLFGPIPPLRALRADCPEGLARIVMRALARDPADRFASAFEMTSALDRWQAGEDLLLSMDTVNELEDPEETLRIYMPSAAPPRSRGRIKKRALAAATCLAALSGLALSQSLHVHSQTEQTTEQFAVQAMHATELSALELALQASALAGALAAHTSACAAELSNQARASAHDLIELVRPSLPAWAGQAEGAARER